MTKCDDLSRRVKGLLRSKAWETRVAAAQAMDAILRHSAPWDPPPGTADGADTDDADGEEDELVAFEEFSLSGVLERGQTLLASAGHEFDEEDMDPVLRLERHRQQLRETLGLPAVPGGGGGGALGAAPHNHRRDLCNVEDMVGDDDLLAPAAAGTGQAEANGRKRRASDRRWLSSSSTTPT